MNDHDRLRAVRRAADDYLAALGDDPAPPGVAALLYRIGEALGAAPDPAPAPPATDPPQTLRARILEVCHPQ